MRFSHWRKYVVNVCGFSRNFTNLISIMCACSSPRFNFNFTLIICAVNFRDNFKILLYWKENRRLYVKDVSKKFTFFRKIQMFRRNWNYSKKLRRFQEIEILPRNWDASKKLKYFQEIMTLPRIWDASKKLRCLQEIKKLPRNWDASKTFTYFREIEMLPRSLDTSKKNLTSSRKCYINKSWKEEKFFSFFFTFT